MNPAAKYLTAIIVTLQITAQAFVHFATSGNDEMQIRATNYYMLCDAICWTLAFGIIAMLVTGLFKQVALIVALLWLGKVMDEIWFNPCILSWNDLLFFNLAQVYAVFVVSKHFFRKTK